MKQSFNRSDIIKQNNPSGRGSVNNSLNSRRRTSSLRNNQSEILSAKAITSLAQNMKNLRPLETSQGNTFDDEINDRLFQLEKMANELYNEKPLVERFSKRFSEMKEQIDKDMGSRVLRIESLDTNISMLKNELTYTNKLVERFARGLERCLEKHPSMIPENIDSMKKKDITDE